MADQSHDRITPCVPLLRRRTPNSPNAGEVAVLQARLARLEPLAKRVDEVETALVAHAKSNRDKFDVSLSCLSCLNDVHACIPSAPALRFLTLAEIKSN
jgi:hypothetical protein